jgi:hypothetical protein
MVCVVIVYMFTEEFLTALVCVVVILHMFIMFIIVLYRTGCAVVIVHVYLYS